MPLILPVIEKCNQRCLFCSALNREEENSLSMLVQRINSENEYVSLTGGEPLMRRDILKIIEIAKNRGLFCELQTNGTLLSTPKIAKAIVMSGADLININYPSHEEKKSDQLTRTSGFFLLRERGIHNLLDLGANIRLTHVINSLNYRDLPLLIEQKRRLFAKVKIIQFSFIKYLGDAKNNPSLLPSYSEVEPFLKEALDKCVERGIEFTIDHLPICFLGKHKDKHVDYRKIIAGQDASIARDDKIQIDACLDCKFTASCLGVRKDYIEAKGIENLALKPITG